MTDNTTHADTSSSQEQAQGQGPVTIDDVRAALGDTDLTKVKTNAQAIRDILGRGSLSTIQKHLHTIRAERMPKLIEEFGAAPPVPKELFASTANLWAQSWAEAQSRTSSALAQAQQEKEFLASALALTVQEHETSQDRIENLENELKKSTEEAGELRAQIEKEKEAGAAALEKATEIARSQLKAAEMEIATLRQEVQYLQQAASLEKAEHAAAISALHTQADRHISLLADIRAGLGRNQA